MNRPVFVGGGASFEPRCLHLLSEHSVKALLGFRRWNVADRLQQPAIVEPVHPGQRRSVRTRDDA